MTTPVLRIHPAIGIARVGNSDEYYLAPESPAGIPQPGGSLVGGLPIRPGTEAEPISDHDLRDAAGALKRQAQRFRIYHYHDAAAAAAYPYVGQVEEVTLGSEIDGKKVADIVWTVHLANKKANCWTMPETTAGPTVIGGLSAYGLGQFPPLRNNGFANPVPPPPAGSPLPESQANPGDPARLASLVIDAGPRAIHGRNAARIVFDRATTPSFNPAGGQIAPLPNYPVSFPADHFPHATSPAGAPVTQLGALETDAQGRLIVIAGAGGATTWNPAAAPGEDPLQPYGLHDDVNNDGWFDDTADGPVGATVVFTDGSSQQIAQPAWVVATDPSFAPQIRNVVSLWDEVFDTWLCCFGLDPQAYDGPPFPTDDRGFRQDFQPAFSTEVLPFLLAAGQQQFVTSLNPTAVGAHQRLAASAAADRRAAQTLLQYIRDPYPPSPFASQPSPLETGAPLMPLALGDTGAAFLTLTKTQFFFLRQWAAGKIEPAPVHPLTAGEQLDRDVLTNCLGGRFSPGIDLTFVVRDPAFYAADWKQPQVGPFRVGATTLDYPSATPGQPFLTVGYVPLGAPGLVEPGDVCKFMALPWHTDYNSCATHLPSPNPGGEIVEPQQALDPSYTTGGEGPVGGQPAVAQINLTLFWSWPGQRPVSVYAYPDLEAAGGSLPQQRFSLRGAGTRPLPGPLPGGIWPAQTHQTNGQVDPGWEGPGAGPDGSFYPIEQVGRFQVRTDFLAEWPKIGTVIQGPAIAGYPTAFDRGYFLEVASRMSNESNLVAPYPNLLTQPVEPVS